MLLDGGASWNNVIDNDMFSGAQNNTLNMYGLTKEFDQYLLLEQMELQTWQKS